MATIAEIAVVRAAINAARSLSTAKAGWESMGTPIVLHAACGTNLVVVWAYSLTTDSALLKGCLVQVVFGRAMGAGLAVILAEQAAIASAQEVGRTMGLLTHRAHGRVLGT